MISDLAFDTNQHEGRELLYRSARPLPTTAHKSRTSERGFSLRSPYYTVQTLCDGRSRFDGIPCNSPVRRQCAAESKLRATIGSSVDSCVQGDEPHSRGRPAEAVTTDQYARFGPTPEHGAGKIDCSGQQRQSETPWSPAWQPCPIRISDVGRGWDHTEAVETIQGV